MAAADCRVGTRAPAHSPRRHRGVAVRGNIATTHSRTCRDIAHHRRRHRRQFIHYLLLGRERTFLAIGRTLAVDGVGPDVICRVVRQSGNAAHETPCTAAVRGVAAANGRIGTRAPANSPRRHRSVAVRGNIASTRSRTCGNIAHHRRRHRRQFIHYLLIGRERTFLAVGRTLAVDGVGPDVICRIVGQTCDTARKTAHAAPIAGVATADGGVVAGTPADATCCDCGIAVAGHTTTAHCRCRGDITHHRRRHRRQLQRWHIVSKHKLYKLIHHLHLRHRLTDGIGRYSYIRHNIAHLEISLSHCFGQSGHLCTAPHLYAIITSVPFIHQFRHPPLRRGPHREKSHLRLRQLYCQLVPPCQKGKFLGNNRLARYAHYLYGNPFGFCQCQRGSGIAHERVGRHRREAADCPLRRLYTLRKVQHKRGVGIIYRLLPTSCEVLYVYTGKRVI